MQYARRKAGFADATAAANAFGINENTYRSHENGARGLKAGTAKRYAKVFHTSAAWLLTGEGDGPTDVTRSLTVDPADLRKIVSLLLRAQNTEQRLADELADTVVECLSEPPLAALDQDVVRSFQVRLELQSRQYERTVSR